MLVVKLLLQAECHRPANPHARRGVVLDPVYVDMCWHCAGSKALRHASFRPPCQIRTLCPHTSQPQSLLFHAGHTHRVQCGGGR